MDLGDDNDMNMTRLDDDDDSKLDINSVLSGNIEDDDDDDNEDADYYGNVNLEGVFGKNLGAIFDDNAGKLEESQQRHLKNNHTNNIAKSVTTTSNGSGNPSRPPLAPGRSLSTNVSGSFKSSNDNNGNNGKQQKIATSNNNNGGDDDKRLSVFLRVRPPVCANGKKGNEGSINTIEVIDGGSSSSTTLPTTIRTYPPLNSNAAKVVRGSNNTTNKHRHHTKNDASNKSLIDDASSVDSGTILDPNAEIRGVKEFGYSGVFGPNSTQCDVYDNVAAPLVEGLFPKNSNGGGGEDVVNSLGESALLFTLGVTNAGKTHTVMGTGFETTSKGKNKMIASMTNKNDCTVPNENWGIIPRSLDHMLSRVNTLNAAAATRNGGGGQQLQMYMSYLEIYNEQIYDLLPGKSDVPRRPCDGPPTLKLRESRRGRIFVRGLARHAVNNVQQGLELAQMAKKNRHTASNNINTESSRSHSICQLEITHSPVVNNGSNGGGKRTGELEADSEYETDDDSSVCSRSSSGSRDTASSGRQRKSTIIWIVDLAGSERSKKTRSHTRHQKEAALINASLMNLMRCLREMLNHQPKKRGATSKGGVVPFRESKLTHMFMNHLTGPAASRTSMIVNVNPAADDYDETQHVLSYAATARNVTISAVDYNRKRRLFAKESKVKTSPTKSPKKALAQIVKKISPKKRKGTADSSSKPQSKRLRSDSHSSSTSALGKKFARTGVARKPPLSETTSAKSTTAGNDDELEKLREENFDLKVTVDDLRQQLEDCENEVREEVVATLSEQMQESKMWYESRIAKLQEEINSLQSSQQAQLNVENDKADLHETIVECEEEMKRMREDHDVEVKELESMSLQLTNEHQTMVDNLTKEHDKQLRAEQMKNKRLEDELGTLRHQARELQVGHESLFSRYNALLAQQSEQRQASMFAASHHEKENPTDAASMPEPSFAKLPRERVSDVASTSSCVDIVSPSKKKRGGKWFVRSPAKVAIGGGGNKMSPARSPLGKVNKK